MRDRIALSLLLTATLVACAKEREEEPGEMDEAYVVAMPPGAPGLPVPSGNEPTVARVSLGKALFFDERLSLGRGLSCASCHHPDRAFSDTTALSAGAGGAVGLRNAPTLANLAYHPAYFRDGGIPTLEQQVLAPVHTENEMASNIVEAATLLHGDEHLASLSRRGYDRELDAFVITRAIACYERTLVSGWSRFDRFRMGEDAALNEEEHRGHALFNSAEVGCAGCHSGFDLSDHSYRNIGTSTDHTADPGRERITLDPADRGKFKVPTLRNVALTGPYMHDGSMATLEEVVEHFAGGGVADPNKDPLMHPLDLSTQDRSDLMAFLRALTDDRSLDQVP
ncbi:MAG: c-type cytochrome [Flavobacteriales bacterium]|nr:c-type cytochrome [Flavobacteriales bacterium]